MMKISKAKGCFVGRDLEKTAIGLGRVWSPSWWGLDGVWYMSRCILAHVWLIFPKMLFFGIFLRHCVLESFPSITSIVMSCIPGVCFDENMIKNAVSDFVPCFDRYFGFLCQDLAFWVSKLFWFWAFGICTCTKYNVYERLWFQLLVSYWFWLLTFKSFTFLASSF